MCQSFFNRKANVNESLKEIIALAERLKTLEQQEAEAEATRKAITAKRMTCEEEDLPNAMREAQLKEFTMEDGSEIKLKDDCYVSISEERRPAVHAWLRANKFGGMIKSMIVASFGKGEEKEAAALFKELKKRKMDVEATEGVHAGTMKAFVNERLRARQPVPLELFGVRQVTRAIVSLPKAKKGK